MKSIVLGFALVLSSVCLAQTNSAAPPPPPAEPPAPGAHMHHRTSDQHVEDMKAQVEKMRTALDQMKASVAKIKDPNARQQAQANVDLWDGMIQHMQGMVSMMSEHHDMGMMGDMPGGMDCCAKMADLKEGGCCGGGQCMKPGEKPDAIK